MVKKFKEMVDTQTFWWYYNLKKGKLKMKLHRVKLTQSKSFKILLFNNARGKQNHRANWDALKAVKVTHRSLGYGLLMSVWWVLSFRRKNSAYILVRSHKMLIITRNIIAINCKLHSIPASTPVFCSLPSDGQYIVYNDTQVAQK